MKKLLTAALGAVVVSGALLGAGTANADSPGAFVSVLHEQGISHVYGDSALINAGYEVCGKLDAGYDVMQAGAYVHNVSGMNLYDSGYVVGAAVGAFCPEYGYQIDALSPGYVA